MTEINRFVQLSALDEATLLASIGEAIASGPEARAYAVRTSGLGARVPRAERLRALATKWIDENRAIIRKAVCDNAAVRTALSNNPGVSVEGFKLLVDTFTALHIYVPVGSLAMLVMRKGIDWACPPSP